MAGRVFTIVQPRTEWFRRVADRLLERSPRLQPLDAVRRAMDAYPDSQFQDPDAVADSLLAADELPPSRSRQADRTRPHRDSD